MSGPGIYLHELGATTAEIAEAEAQLERYRTPTDYPDPLVVAVVVLLRRTATLKETVETLKREAESARVARLLG